MHAATPTRVLESGSTAPGARPATGGGPGALGPWFRLRPGRAVLVAGVLIVVCAALGATRADDRTLALALFALPVSLMAVTFGRIGGAGTGLVGLGLAGAWSLPGLGSDVGATGWAAVATMVVLGALLGEAVDEREASDHRALCAEAAQDRLEDRLRRQAEAVAINDLMVQSVAVARWALEAGDVERALQVLGDIGEAGQRLVSSLLRDTAPLTMPAELSRDGNGCGAVSSGSSGSTGRTEAATSPMQARSAHQR